MAPEGDVRTCADCGTSIADRDGRAAYCYACAGRRAARQRLEWQRQHRTQMAPEERQREIERIRAWRLVNPTVPAPPRVVKCATVLCEGTFAARGNGRFCLDCRRFNNVYASERSRLAKRRAREAARQAKRSLDYLEQGG